jgi:hypothetical protein
MRGALSPQKTTLLETFSNADSGTPPDSGNEDWSACCSGKEKRLRDTSTTLLTLFSMVHSNGLANIVLDTVEVSKNVEGEKRRRRSVRITEALASAVEQNDNLTALERVKPFTGERSEKSRRDESIEEKYTDIICVASRSLPGLLVVLVLLLLVYYYYYYLLVVVLVILLVLLALLLLPSSTY